MRLNRRSFLWSAAASGLVVPYSLRAQSAPAASSSRRFPHGVASGDPLADRVILWTRVAPAGMNVVDVRWTVAADPAFARVVASGTTRTGAARDFTVKVDAGGLEPATTYYYRFQTGTDRSPVGRTKTLPAGAVSRVRLAVASCSNYPFGFFNAYGRIAARPDLDAVVHLGDYIYEFENGRFGDGTSLKRLPQPPREIVTLDDYRLRYATYRTDPDLQEAHRQHPFIVVWDDHEIANDAWSGGAENHNSDKGEGDYQRRKAAAYQAYLEWMPVRATSDRQMRLYRTFQFGGLADLVMLDTRIVGRDRQAGPEDAATIAAPGRSLLGAAQEHWLFGELRESARAGSAWRLLGQQVLFSPITVPGQRVRGVDAWEGYAAARGRVLDFIERERMRDLVVLTGDVHSSWALDVARNPWDGSYTAASGRGSLGVEFVTPAITSQPAFSGDKARERAAAFRGTLPHLKFLDGEHRGYVVLDVTPQRVQADWFFVPDVTTRNSAETPGASFLTERGSSRVVDAGKPAATQDAPLLAE